MSNNGSELTLNCQKGYVIQLQGQYPQKNPMLTRKCEPSGRWQDQDIPWACVKAQCNQPPRTSHARIVSKRKRIYKYPDEVLYECLEGYQMEGNATKSCQEDGEWTQDNFQCSGKPSHPCKPISQLYNRLNYFRHLLQSFPPGTGRKHHDPQRAHPRRGLPGHKTIRSRHGPRDILPGRALPCDVRRKQDMGPAGPKMPPRTGRIMRRGRPAGHPRQRVRHGVLGELHQVRNGSSVLVQVQERIRTGRDEFDGLPRGRVDPGERELRP